MSLSRGTATMPYEDLRARAALAAMFRDSLVDETPHSGPAYITSATRPPGSTSLVDETSRSGAAALGQIASLASHVGSRADSAPDPEPTPLVNSILSATSHEQVFAALPALGFGAIAERLTYLHEITSDGDPDEPPMAFSSLQQCALFFVSEPHHRDADVAISPDGLLQAQWRAKGGGVLAIRFLPSGFLQFAGVSESGIPAERRRVHGTLPKDQALHALKPFLPESRS